MQAYTAHLALPSRFISILNSIRNWLFSSPLKVKMLTSSWVYLSYSTEEETLVQRW